MKKVTTTEIKKTLIENADSCVDIEKFDELYNFFQCQLRIRTYEELIKNNIDFLPITTESEDKIYLNDSNDIIAQPIILKVQTTFYNDIFGNMENPKLKRVAIAFLAEMIQTK